MRNIRDFFRLLFSGNFHAAFYASKDSKVMYHLIELNKSIDKQEEYLRKKYDENAKLHRIKLIDFFIS